MSASVLTVFVIIPHSNEENYSIEVIYVGILKPGFTSVQTIGIPLTSKKIRP